MHILIFKCTVFTNNSCVKEYSVITNIFLWNESDDINNNNNNKKEKKKKVISKMPVDSTFMFTSLMHDYVHWNCSIHYCIRLILINETSCENCSYFTLKWFLFNSSGEMCFLEESYK